jgi:hypothetical protein
MPSSSLVRAAPGEPQHHLIKVAFGSGAVKPHPEQLSSALPQIADIDFSREDFSVGPFLEVVDNTLGASVAREKVSHSATSTNHHWPRMGIPQSSAIRPSSKR